MNALVTIVDYGMGNILSVSRALEHCGAKFVLSDKPDEVAKADYIVLPGVGAFGAAANALTELHLDEALHAFARTGRPFLGICIGMQLMMSTSEEFGQHNGLGFIDGRVTAIPDAAADGTPHTVPHIGWNAIHPAHGTWEGTALADTPKGAEVYFVHSYHAAPDDGADVLAVADYDGQQITAAVTRDNMTGVQFHPEKSGEAGLRIMKRFLQQ